MAAKAQTDKKPWEFFIEKIDKIPAPISDVLEGYAGIEKGQAQIDHVLRVRNRAYEARPYPCLGRFRFLELDLSTHPLYQSAVLPKLTETSTDTEREPILLDLGTCLGQDIRKLVYDGVKPERLYASDIVPDFINAGHELFKDHNRIPQSHFLCPANLFDDSPANPLNELNDKVDILHITAVFHLFSGEKQIPVAERCLRLVKKSPGSRTLILGAQVGNIVAQESVRNDGDRKYRHNEESWRLLWENVTSQDEFRSKVKKLEVKAELQGRSETSGSTDQQQKHIGTIDEGYRWMVWSVWVEF